MNPHPRDDDIGTLGPTVIAYYRTMASARENPRHEAANLSHAEVMFAEALMRAGIPFEQQKQIGRRWADFWIEELAAVVEIDGAAFHSDEEAESRRDAELMANGAGAVLHIRAIEVFSDPLAAVARVDALITRLTGRKR